MQSWQNLKQFSEVLNMDVHVHGVAGNEKLIKKRDAVELSIILYS